MSRECWCFHSWESPVAISRWASLFLYILWHNYEVYFNDKWYISISWIPSSSQLPRNSWWETGSLRFLGRFLFAWVLPSRGEVIIVYTCDMFYWLLPGGQLASRPTVFLGIGGFCEAVVTVQQRFSYLLIWAYQLSFWWNLTQTNQQKDAEGVFRKTCDIVQKEMTLLFHCFEIELAWFEGQDKQGLGEWCGFISGLVMPQNTSILSVSADTQPNNLAAYMEKVTRWPWLCLKIVYTMLYHPRGISLKGNIMIK